MTIASTVTQVLYASTGANTQYPFPNKVFEFADLAVTIIDTAGTLYPFVNGANATLGLTYSIQNVDVDTGSTVVFSAVQTAGWSIDIRSSTPELQSTSIKNQGNFLPELHEEAFDRLTREVQDLARLTYTYGLHGPDIESTPWPQLPPKAQRANLVILGDINGNLVMGAVTNTPVTSALIQTLLPAALTRKILGDVEFPRTQREITNGVVPTDDLWDYTLADLRRYGALLDGTTDDTAAVLKALQVIGSAPPETPATLAVYGNCRVTQTIAIPANVKVLFYNEAKFLPDATFSVFVGRTLGRIANLNPRATGVPTPTDGIYDAFGDSITAGANAILNSNCFVQKFGTRLRAGLINNNGVSGTGVSRQMITAFTVLPKWGMKGRVMTWMAGFNDIERNGTAVGCLDKIEDCCRAFLCNAFLKFAVAASDASVTKTGTWASALGQTDKSALNLGGNVETTNTINDHLSWTFSGDSLVIGFFDSDGSTYVLSPFSVTVDGVLLETYSPEGRTDNNPGADIITHPTEQYFGLTQNARYYTGLGSGAHTVVVNNTAANRMFVDYLGTLAAPGDCPTVLIGEVPHVNVAGYAANPLRSPLVDDYASSIERTVAELFMNQGFPVAVVPVNDYYNANTEIDTSDNTHPTPLGHTHLADAYASRSFPMGKPALPSVSLQVSAAIALPTSTNTALGWNVIVDAQDPLGFRDNTTNSKIDCPFTGTMQLSGCISFSGNVTGVRNVSIRKNGATILRNVASVSAAEASQPTTVSFCANFSLVAGDYVEVLALQDSGAALTITTNSQVEVAMIR